LQSSAKYILPNGKQYATRVAGKGDMKMTRQDFANMETADLARLLGVRVTRGFSKGGYMVHKVICEGEANPMAELRPSKVRSFLIDAAISFDEGGAFA
jgi:hypothetical protein